MSLINLDLVFNAITSIANPLIKEKILRSETVIKLLQQFHLDPEHPPADFSGVYAYALVEYGVGKPKPLLELFRQEAIKQAFRTALDHNNPSILLSEVDAFLDTYTLGDDIRSLELDVRREVAEFATVFIEVAKRTRTPADVLLNQKIGSLHKRIACIQEQLERLPTLEGIRTEIARLAVENYPALPGTTTENQCRAIALAQQMRGWFETLGYDFEKYEIWAEEYFEWIIHIPVRRSYDRILISGVAGEVGLSDVMALRSSVEAQKTDEGWLVTTRRISRAARDEVKKEENHRLDCFTFDELIDLDADFNGYLDWLEAEIKRRKIDTLYVPLACTKLVRNADGDYTPAHRSLLEFFVAYKFAAELGALASDFTELAQAQSGLDSSTAPVDYTWSGYFSRQRSSEAMPVAIPLAIAPLRRFISESLEKLKETFGQSPLTKIENKS